jgi:adenine-specific DNA-methyltransferase
VLAVSIDHNEVSNLKALLGDVFGEENFVNQLAWVNNLKGRQISGSGAALTHEFILVFAKNINELDTFSVQVDWAKARMPSAYKGFNYEVLRDAKGEYVLKNQLYNTNSAFNEETRPNLVFDIHYNPETGQVRTATVGDPVVGAGFHVIPPHRCNDGRHKYHAWRWSRSKVEGESDDLAFVKAGDRFQIFTKVRGHGVTALKDLISDITTNEGEKDLESLFGENPFSYPKPVSLIRTLIQALGGDDDGVVLDFFAGSGTTAHAVIAQNADDGQARRFVLVQLPEPLADDDKQQAIAAALCKQCRLPPNLAALTAERLRRVSEECPVRRLWLPALQARPIQHSRLAA